MLTIQRTTRTQGRTDVAFRTTRDGRPKVFECGGCGHWHPFGWADDLSRRRASIHVRRPRYTVSRLQPRRLARLDRSERDDRTLNAAWLWIPLRLKRGSH